MTQNVSKMLFVINSRKAYIYGRRERVTAAQGGKAKERKIPAKGRRRGGKGNKQTKRETRRNKQERREKKKRENRRSYSRL